MQPHSMCFLGVANYFWRSLSRPKATTLSMNIRYIDRRGDQRTNKYEIYNIQFVGENEFKGTIRRDGSGMSPCQVTVTRRESQIRMFHSDKHGHGTWEEFTMSKDRISSGRVVNSQWYKGFDGNIEHLKKVTLSCRIVQEVAERKTFTESTVKYELTIN